MLSSSVGLLGLGAVLYLIWCDLPRKLPLGAMLAPVFGAGVVALLMVALCFRHLIARWNLVKRKQKLVKEVSR